MNTIPLFVYGTLRKGFDLHDCIANAIVSEVSVGECHVRGTLYFCPGANFPVLSTTHTRDVTGDLYLVNPDHPNVRDTFLMELNAGYSLEWLDVYARNTAQIITSAVAFTWKSSHVGPKIVSGDYARLNERTAT